MSSCRLSSCLSTQKFDCQNSKHGRANDWPNPMRRPIGSRSAAAAKRSPIGFKSDSIKLPNRSVQNCYIATADDRRRRSVKHDSVIEIESRWAPRPNRLTLRADGSSGRTDGTAPRERRDAAATVIRFHSRQKSHLSNFV